MIVQLYFNGYFMALSIVYFLHRDGITNAHDYGLVQKLIVLYLLVEHWV